MKLVDHYDEAFAHYVAAVAILDAFLSHGQKGAFVRGIGKTLSWFSRFCNIERCDLTYLPSLETAKEMAKKLPAPESYREALIFHITEVKRLKSAFLRETEVYVKQRVPIKEITVDIASSHKIARNSADSAQVRYHYRRIFDIASLVLPNIDPTVSPSDFLYLCGFMIDVSYTMDRADLGIYWSKIMEQVILRLLDRSSTNCELKEILIEQQIVQSCNEGTGYHNLGKDKYAIECYNKALMIIKSQNHNQKWIPAILRGRLIALCGTSKFAISEAESISEQGMRYLERNNNISGIIMMKEALARAYIEHYRKLGYKINIRKSQKLLNDALTKSDTTTGIGKLDRVIVLQTLANLCFSEGDYDLCAEYAVQALEIARKSGLIHKEHQIVEKYSFLLSNREIAA